MNSLKSARLPDMLDQVRTVEARITYLVPGSAVNRRFVAPGAEVNTGTYAPYSVRVRDGRSIKDQFSLDTHGFVLAEHHSRVIDFFDKAQVDAVYPDEVTAAVKRLTGADRVAPLGWMARTSGDLSRFQRQTIGYTHKGGVQPPAGEAHVDMTPGRAAAMALDIYQRFFSDGRPYRRFIASSLWRAFSPGPQDWPVAVCEGGSVGPDEGTPNTMFIVDQLPDRAAMLAEIPDEDQAPAADVFTYNPGHRWWYFSNMHRDEVLLFKFYDSDRTRTWRVPHTAFHDTSFPNPVVRESIEFRTVAYFL
jgi:hypothetical protein